MAKNFLDEAEDLGKAPKQAGVDIEPSTFEKIINVIDIPASIARTGIKAAITPGEEVLPAISSQIEKTVKQPTIAASEAPTGEDINKQIFPEYKSESIPGMIGNLTTEIAIDPLFWFRPTKTPAKAVSVKLEKASERQAAKAISKFASKASNLKEGVDPEAIGTRLVQQDMSSLIKEPLKLYEKISGKKELQKINPQNLETLQIKRGPREGGEIGRISGDITTMLHDVSRNYGLEPVKLPEIHFNELVNNSLKNISLTSGETKDLEKISEKLTSILKPTKEISLPPEAPRGLKSNLQVPNKLSLPQLQELRKNIGKQVADRAFFASPDQAMKLETEVLKDLYRSLGDVIENSLKGKEIEIAGKTLDAAEYYKGQNNALKQFLDVQSLLESQPLENLKSPDLAANIGSILAKGAGWGTAAGVATMAGLPVNPTSAVAVGSILGAGKAASDIVKNRTPEYLAPMLKTASEAVDIPYLPEAATRAGVMVGREPQSVSPLAKYGMTRSQIARAKLPRDTEIIRRNPELFLAKLSQVPGTTLEEVRTAEQVFRESPLKIKSMIQKAALMHPEIFEDSEYQILDGKILDPAERGAAADSISKRDDLTSIQKAKMISALNKDGTYLGE